MELSNKVRVRARDLELSREERGVLEQRVLHAVDRFADSIDRIDVMMTDVNGPRGGVDTRCRVHVALASGAIIDVHAEGESALQAFARVSGRLRRALAGVSVSHVADPRRSLRMVQPAPLSDAPASP